MSMLSFRQYLNASNKIDEMAMGTKLRSHIPAVPPMVRNLLVHVRGVGDTGGEREQHEILHWIFKQGLNQALVGRRRITADANRELEGMGKQPAITEDKFFDKDLWPNMAKRCGMEAAEFGAFMTKKYQEYEEKYEPKEVLYGSHNVINLVALRGYLQKQGLQPFSFGGPNGLIEYLENDKKGWAPQIVAQDPHGHEDRPRHGIDLSGPVDIRDPSTNRYITRTDNWAPPQNPKDFSRALNALKLHAANTVPGMLGSSGELDPDDDDLISYPASSLEKVARRKMQPVAQLFGFDLNSSVGKFPTGEWPQFNDATYNMLKKCFAAGLEEVAAKEPGREAFTHPDLKIDKPQLSDIVNHCFDDATKTVKGAWWVKPAGRPKYRSDIAKFVNEGAKKLGFTTQDIMAAKTPDGKPMYNTIYKTDATQFNHKFKDAEFGGRYTKFTDTPVDIKDLLQQGWDFLGGEEPTAGATEITMEKGRSRKKLVNINNRWHERVHDPKSFQKHTSPDARTPFLGVSGINRLEGGKSHYRGAFGSPADMPREVGMANDKLATDKQNDWLANLYTKYGEDSSKSRIRDGSIAPSAAIAAQKAIDRAMGTGQFGAQWVPEKGLSFELANIGQQLVKGMVNDRSFRFGDMDYTPRPKLDPATGTMEEPRTSIDKLLEKAGVADPAKREELIEKMRGFQATGQDPAVDPDFAGEGNPILGAFQTNGFNWRTAKLASKLQGEIKGLIQKDRSLMQGTGDDAKEMDPSERQTASDRMRLIRGDNGRNNRVDLRNDTSAPVRQWEEKGLFFNARHRGDELNDPGALATYSRAYETARSTLERNVEGRPKYSSLSMAIRAAVAEPDYDTQVAKVDAVGDVLSKSVDAYLAAGDKLDDISKDDLANLYEKFIASKGTFAAWLGGPVTVLYDKIQKSPVMPLIQAHLDNKNKAAPAAPKPEVPAAPAQSQPQDREFTVNAQGGDHTPVTSPYGTFKNKAEYDALVKQHATNPQATSHLNQLAQNTKHPSYTRAAAKPSGGGLGGYMQRRKVEWLTFSQWRDKRLAESIRRHTVMKETEAIYDGSQGTFNWWGAVGKPGGKCIEGDIPVKKTNGRKTKRK